MICKTTGGGRYGKEIEGRRGEKGEKGKGGGKQMFLFFLRTKIFLKTIKEVTRTNGTKNLIRRKEGEGIHQKNSLFRHLQNNVEET